MLNKYSIVLLVSLTTILLLHLVPTMFIDNAFSPDSLPLIHDSRILVSNPKVKVYNDSVMDGYDNHWPLSIVYSSIGELLTGINIAFFHKMLIPFIYGLSTISLFAFARRIFGNNDKGFAKSIVALLYLNLFPSFLIFTSASTKETIAYPLLFTLLLLISLDRVKWIERTILSLILVIGFVLSHNLLVFVFCIVLFFMGIYSFLRNIITRYTEKIYSMTILFILVIVFVSYNLHARPPGEDYMLEYFIRYSASMFAYVTVFFSIGIFLLRIDDNRIKISYKGFITSLLTVLAILTILIIAARESPTYGLPPLGIDIIYYAAPIIFTPLFLYVGLKESLGKPAFIAIVSMLTSILGLIFFLFLGSFGGSYVVHRLANYMIIPLSLGIASCFNRNIYTKIGIILLVIISISSSIIVYYRLINGNDNISYYWVYHTSEYNGMSFTACYGGNLSIIGDSKTYYLGKAFSIRVNIRDLITNLKDPEKIKGILFIRRDNILRGFVVSLYVMKVKDIMSIIYNGDIVYQNKEVVVVKNDS